MDPMLYLLYRQRRFKLLYVSGVPPFPKIDTRRFYVQLNRES